MEGLTKKVIDLTSTMIILNARISELVGILLNMQDFNLSRIVSRLCTELQYAREEVLNAHQQFIEFVCNLTITTASAFVSSQTTAEAQPASKSVETQTLAPISLFPPFVAQPLSTPANAPKSKTLRGRATSGRGRSTAKTRSNARRRLIVDEHDEQDVTKDELENFEEIESD